MNDWVNNRGAGDLRRHRAHYDGIVMGAKETWSSDTGHRSLIYIEVNPVEINRCLHEVHVNILVADERMGAS